MRDPTAVTLTTGKTLYDALFAHMLYLGSSRDAPAKLLNLTGEDLTYVDFTGWNLDKGRFNNCDFTGAVIADGTLYSPLFINCTLTYTQFSVAVLSRARFYLCSLQNTRFVRVTFDACSTYRCPMDRVDFTAAVPKDLTIYIRTEDLNDDLMNGTLNNYADLNVVVSGATLSGSDAPSQVERNTVPPDMV